MWMLPMGKRNVITMWMLPTGRGKTNTISMWMLPMDKRNVITMWMSKMIHDDHQNLAVES
jgi:hypothetical protein